MQRIREILAASNRARNWVILSVLALTIAVTPPNSERFGDRLQIALPLLGLGCAVVTGGAGEYLLRFTAGLAVVHASKNALGEIPLNARPWGGYHGFPSGHSAAAAFGTSALVNNCIANSPFVKATVVIAGGFVGASRIEAGAHNIWQVLAGIIVGFLFERALRRNSPRRARMTQFFHWIVQRFRRIKGPK